MSEKTLEMTLLFDFFGDLLTEKQREYFDLYYNSDLSLSEIAELNGISRQGVRDLIMRADAQLREYELKTGVVARFSQMQRSLHHLKDKADKLCELSSTDEARALAQELSEGLDKLKG